MRNYIEQLRARAKEIDEDLESCAAEWDCEDVDDLIDSGNLDFEGIASIHIDIGRRDTLNQIANELEMKGGDVND